MAQQRPVAVAPGPPVAKQLPVVDASGRLADYSAGVAAGKPPPRRVERYGEDGAKARYFASDDAEGASLASLRAAEAQRRAGALDEAMARGIVRAGQHGRYKGPVSADDEYDFDVGVDAGEARVSKRARRDGGKSAEAAARARGIADARALERAARDDWLRSSPHLVLATSPRAYLMLAPGNMRLVEGHCYVVPIEHTGATRSLDEGTWEDMRNFKKCLLRMWGDKARHVVFLETVLGLGRKGTPPRCIVEAIPVSDEAFSLAPMHFKRAIDEAEDEWATHAAKRLIDTSTKGLRASVPEGFAYFHVEFGLRRGYAHVIDDEQRWQRSFGRDTLAGAMGVDPGGRRRGHANVQYDTAAADALRRGYTPYDWTAALQQQGGSGARHAR